MNAWRSPEKLESAGDREGLVSRKVLIPWRYLDTGDSNEFEGVDVILCTSEIV